MPGAGAVAGFAAYTLFAEVRFSSRTERDRAGGVAFEASGDAPLWINGLVEQSRGLRQRGWMNRVLPGRRAPGAQSGVVGRVVFHIPVFVDFGDECDCLAAGAKSPLHR